MLKNTKISWGFGAQFLHWLVFILFTGMLILGAVMEAMEKGDVLLGIGKYTFYDYHKSIGLFVLLIVFIRISWRMANVSPETAPLKKHEKLAAHTVHYLLYVTMLLMPISGYVMSMAGDYGINIFGNKAWPVPNLLTVDKGLSDFAREVHDYTGTMIYILLAIHITAALFHHFYRKDNVLKAMLPHKRS